MEVKIVKLFRVEDMREIGLREKYLSRKKKKKIKRKFTGNYWVFGREPSKEKT